MSDLKFVLNTDAIAKEMSDLASSMKKDLDRAVGDLAPMTHAKVLELGKAELHSSLRKLIENTGYEEIQEGIWVVYIDEGALFIEDGVQPGTDMKPGLLKNNAKISAKGYRYKSINFDHGAAPSTMTPFAQNLVNTIKSRLKKENIPFKKIEKNQDGSPRLGKLHEFSGKNKITSAYPSPRASNEALDNLSIYQSMTKSGNVRRDIVTFRTVSDNPTQKDKWINEKGVSAHKFLDRAFDWAVKEFENNILPAILEKYGVK